MPFLVQELFMGLSVIACLGIYFYEAVTDHIIDYLTGGILAILLETRATAFFAMCWEINPS